jgi:hypothetical protein
MPEGIAAEASIPVKVGSVELRIPKAFQRDARPRADGIAGLHCKCNSREVFVSLPRSGRETLRAFHRELADLPKRYHKSVPRLHTAIYEASSGEFRWSMSWDELAWHSWLMKRSVLVRSPNVRRLETLFGAEIEGNLKEMTRSAVFEWYSTDGVAFGSVVFDQDNGEIDLEWVRPVCRSLRFSGAVYPDEVPCETVAGLIEVPAASQ